MNKNILKRYVSYYTNFDKEDFAENFITINRLLDTKLNELKSGIKLDIGSDGSFIKFVKKIILIPKA